MPMAVYWQHFFSFFVSFKRGTLRVHLKINLLFRNCKKMWWVVPEKETCFMKTDAHHFHQSLPQICLSIFFEKPDSVSVSLTPDRLSPMWLQGWVESWSEESPEHTSWRASGIFALQDMKFHLGNSHEQFSKIETQKLLGAQALPQTKSFLEILEKYNVI